MRKFWIDCVIATAFVFLAMWGIFGLTQLKIFNAFDSIGTALSDVELTDYVFSSLRETPNVEENIIVVNIGNLTRRQLAEELQIISKYKPKAIGIDIFFDCWTGLRDTVNCPALRDTLGNLMLANAIEEAGNVILVSSVQQRDTTLDANTFDSLRRSDEMYLSGAYRDGYANLETEAAYQDDAKTCRNFNPRIKVKDKFHYAFSVELARAFDSVKTEKFLQRDVYSEVINYRGNVFDFHGITNYPQMFYALDIDQVMNEDFASELIKDKIIIMGFLGERMDVMSWEDKFYTPLNKKLAGKANPDMFGVVVHANIISMILKEDFVQQMADWQEVVMAIILCLLNVALFSLINTNLPLWYDGITKLLQLIQLLLYSVLMVLIFHWFKFKLSITLSLAAVALVGDIYEVYMSVIKNTFFKVVRWFSITRKDDDVLIAETPEKP
jgi:CHASE2 domain-containing sensor protein